MDDDLVDESNLGHQRFSKVDVGLTKVTALANRLDSLSKVSIQPIEEKLTDMSQLVDYDFIIVAVDRMDPRQLVHNSRAQWLDLRCQGDGYVVLDNSTEPGIITMIPGNENATSCQIEGAYEFQNIEFGFSICATIGAQWLFQKIRQFHGYETKAPSFQMGSITNGELRLSGVTY
jgi:hypothetical protein